MVKINSEMFLKAVEKAELKMCEGMNRQGTWHGGKNLSLVKYTFGNVSELTYPKTTVDDRNKIEVEINKRVHSRICVLQCCEQVDELKIPLQNC